MKKFFGACLLMLAALVAITPAADAQSVKIKFKQMEYAVGPGYIPVSDANGKGVWVLPGFMSYTDTAGMLANYRTRIQNLEAGILLKEDKINKVTDLTNANNTTYPTTLAVQTAITNAGGAYIPLTEKAAANGVATLDAGGKIPSTQIPAIALTETFVVNSQAAMLAIAGAEIGDVAVRTDISKNFILQTGTAGTLGNWVELLAPASAVTSVNGQTGAVTLTTTNINEGTNLYYTDARVRAAVTGAAPIVVNSGTGVISHATSGVTPGTYTSVTVDDKGHVTGATNPGFLTTEVDPTVPAHVKAITTTNVSNWNSAYADRITGIGVTGTTTKTVTLTVPGATNLTASFTDLQGTSYTRIAQQYTGAPANTFTLSQTPAGTQGMDIYLNGVALHAADYSVTGTTVTTTFTAEASDFVTIKYAY